MATILIVEDNNDIHELLKDLFGTEHRVFSLFWNGRLMVFAQEAIDFGITDICCQGKW